MRVAMLVYNARNRGSELTGIGPCRETETMSPGEIYAKTDEGLRELKERTRNLAHRVCAACSS